MQRDDIRGRTAPAWLQQILTRRYGLTPFGEPRYRLVWAPARVERSGGIWIDWEATTSMQARQAAVNCEADQNSPIPRRLREVCSGAWRSCAGCRSIPARSAG